MFFALFIIIIICNFNQYMIVLCNFNYYIIVVIDKVKQFTS